MIILATLLIIAMVAGATARYCCNSYDREGWLFVTMATAITCGIGLLIAVAMLPMQRMAVAARIVECHAIDTSRGGINDLDNATYRLKIAECNAWLASAKYYDSTMFDLWYPDSIRSVNAIK